MSICHCLLGSHKRISLPTLQSVRSVLTYAVRCLHMPLHMPTYAVTYAVRCLHMPLHMPTYAYIVRSVLTYASLGWFPFLCNTATNHLEVLHRAACRVITGCLFSTPSSLLLLEAQLPPLKLTLEHQTLYSFERALRLPPTFPAFMPWQLETFPVDYRRNPPVDHSVLQPHNHSNPHASL